MVLSNNKEAEMVSLKNIVASFSEGLDSVVNGVILPITLLITKEEANRIAFRCSKINRALELDPSLNQFQRSAYDEFVFLYSAPFHESGIEDKCYAVLNINVLQWLVNKGRYSVDYLIDDGQVYDIVELLPAAKRKESEKAWKYQYDVVKTSNDELIFLRDLAKEALERKNEQPVEMKRIPESGA